MAAKSYVLGMARRPLTTYDADWQLVCLLCVTLPSFENGLAARSTCPAARRACDSPTRSAPEARWGDGVPVTTEDVLFT